MKIYQFEDYRDYKTDKTIVTDNIEHTDNLVDYMNSMRADDDEYGPIIENYVKKLIQNNKSGEELFDEYNRIIRKHLYELSSVGKDKAAIKIIDIFIRTWENDDGKLAVAYEDRSRYMAADGKLQIAYRNIVRARELYNKAYGNNDIRTIRTRIATANYIRSFTSDDKADDMLKEITDDCTEFFNSNSQEIPYIIEAIIDAYGFRNCETEEVEKLRKLCYEKCCIIYGKEHKKSLEALLKIPDSYPFRDPERCLTDSLHGYEQCQTYLGKEDPLTLKSKTQLATAYQDMFEHKQALTIMSEVYDVTTKLFGIKSKEAMKSLLSLAICVKEALSFPNDLINKKILYEAQRKEYGDELLAHDKEEIEKMEANLGDYLYVKYQADKIMDMIDKTLISLKENEARIYSWKGIIYDSLEEHEKAITNMEKCYEVTVLEHGETHKESIYILSQIGLFQQNADQWDKATESFKKGWMQANKAYGSNDSYTKMMYDSYIYALSVSGIMF